MYLKKNQNALGRYFCLRVFVVNKKSLTKYNNNESLTKYSNNDMINVMIIALQKLLCMLVVNKKSLTKYRNSAMTNALQETLLSCFVLNHGTKYER